MTNDTDACSFPIEPIHEADKPAVLDLFGGVFAHVMSNASGFIDSVSDWKESRLVRVDGRVVGAYTLSICDIPPFFGEKEDTTRYRTAWRKGKGVQGIALAVDPAFRGLGIGRALRAYPESTGRFAYSWGLAYKSLNNLKEWMGYRRLISDSGALHVTLRDHQAKALAGHHRFQTSGYDCGPTCLQILASYLNGKPFADYPALLELTGCNPVSGTIGTGMGKALEILGIPYLRNPSRDMKRSFDLLDESLAGGCPFIVRTLTHGIKHWTIAYAKSPDGNYLLADPSLGLHAVTVVELNQRWAPREYDGFAVL